MNLEPFLIPTFFVILNILGKSSHCELLSKARFFPTFFVIPNILGKFDAIKGGNIGRNRLLRAVRKLFSLRLNAILLRFFDYFNCFNKVY